MRHIGMMQEAQISKQYALFCDNKLVKKEPEKYVDVTVAVERVLESWKDSILSFEFINGNGDLRADKELTDKNLKRRHEIEERMSEGKQLEKPILGIGLMDNVEIGSGRDVFMTLAFHGYTTLNVHVRKSQLDEFEDYII